jgi:hypothetical protein
MRIHRPTPSQGAFARHLLPAALAVALAAGGAAVAAAQERPTGHSPEGPVTNPMRPIVASPSSGPPGTVVTLRPMHLPAVTPVQVSIGGTRSGFEVLGQMMTDQQGELTGPVSFRVPDWTERDRTYVFMVLDLYFKPLAASPVFYVTGEDGTVLRQGLIAEGGASCPTLQDEEGVSYALTGATQQLQPGDSVAVEGIVSDRSGCREGPSIEVRRVRRLQGTQAAGALPGAEAALRSAPARSRARPRRETSRTR